MHLTARQGIADTQNLPHISREIFLRRPKQQSVASVAVVLTDLLRVVMVESCQSLDDPIVGHVLVRLLTGVGEHLPKGHRKRPHVRLGGEFTLQRTQTRSLGRRKVTSNAFVL